VVSTMQVCITLYHHFIIFEQALDCNNCMHAGIYLPDPCFCIYSLMHAGEPLLGTTASCPGASSWLDMLSLKGT